MISAHAGHAHHGMHLTFALFCVVVVVGCVLAARLSSPRAVPTTAPDARPRDVVPQDRISRLDVVHRDDIPAVLRRGAGG